VLIVAHRNVMSHQVQPLMTTVAGRLFCVDVSGLKTPNARLKTTLCADAGTHELCVFKMGTHAHEETYLGCRSCVFTSSKVLSDVNAEAMTILSMRAQLEQTAVLDFYDVAQPMANKLPRSARSQPLRLPAASSLLDTVNSQLIMSGKGVKGLGKGGAKRHRKV
jgi:hypothetical protein